MVLPDGHAATVKPGALTTQPASAPTSPSSVDRFFAFSNDLMTDVIPLVESAYRVKTDAAHRAIAGLSMGGGQSLGVSLAFPQKFAYVGLMRAGFRGSEDLDRAFPDVAAGKFKGGAPFKLYWVGCGKKDRLFSAVNEKLDKWLTVRGISHEFHQGEGSHDWRVWRRNLIEIAPTPLRQVMNAARAVYFAAGADGRSAAKRCDHFRLIAALGCLARRIHAGCDFVRHFRSHLVYWARVL